MINDWDSLSNASRNDFVFESRNKSFGAYPLRKNYYRTLIRSLSVTIVTAFFISVISFFIHLSESRMTAGNHVSEKIILGDPPPIDRTTPPPPPVVVPPPVQKVIKFTPPKIVRDEEITDLPPVINENKTAETEIENAEGVEPINDFPPDEKVRPDENVYLFVDEMPIFPGGEKKLFDLLSKINYPQEAQENGISGWVYLTFIIDRDGKIKEAKVEKGIGGGCDQEALRVLNSLPSWTPGKKNGQCVAVKSNVRVAFTLR